MDRPQRRHFLIEALVDFIHRMKVPNHFLQDAEVTF